MAFLLITGCGTAYAEAAATDATPAEESAPAAITMGNLLIDMIDACGDTTGEGIARIDADVAAISDEVAAAVAEAWKRVYLDPEYHLFIHGADDPSELP